MSRAWPVAGIDPEATLAENARRILAVKIAELYSYAPAIPVEAASEALHDMRIAAKRLRYTLELFRAVFGEVGERQIERVKALQEELGTLHDLDVRIALVEEDLARQASAQAAAVSRELAGAGAEEHAAITAAALRPPPDDPRRGLITLLGRQHAARRERYRSFVALWERSNAEGMRGELVGLSAAPVGSDGRDEAPGAGG